MCSIPNTGGVQVTQKAFIAQPCFCVLLNHSEMVGSLQEEIAGRTDHLELNAIMGKKILLLFVL